MALNPPQVLAPRVDLGVRYGNPKLNSVVMVIATWDDPAINPVTVNVNGTGPQTVTMVPVGTDYANNVNLPAPGGVTPAGIQGQVGWVGNITLSGLNPFGQANPYAVSQTGRGDTTGNLVAAPASGQKHTVHVGTCDRALAATSGVAFNVIREPQASGMWPFIHKDDEDAFTPPVSAVCMIDDVNGYVGWQWVDDSVGQVGASGHRMTNEAFTDLAASASWSTLAYDYALAYFIALGMGSVDSTSASDIGLGGERVMSWWGRNVDRLWCQHNLPMLPQYGDHEVSQDFGVSVNNTSGGNPPWGSGMRTGVNFHPTLDNGSVQAANGVFANGEWARYAWDAAIGEVWTLMMVPLQGDSIGIDPANHWATTLGDLYIVSPDAMYNGTGDSHNADGSDTQPTMVAMFGQQQITDIKNALNNTVPFKAILSPMGFRSLNQVGNPSTPNSRAVNWPLYDLQRAEFDSLFVENDGLSVMSNPNTVGRTVFVSGDTHYQWACHATAPANGGNLAEDLIICNAGTISGSDLVAANSAMADVNDMTILTKSTAWGQDKRDRGIGIVSLQYTDTLRVFMVNGKINSSFDVGIDRVFIGDSDMGKTFTQAEAEANAQNYDLDGSERMGLDADDPAFPGAPVNYGKTLNDVSNLMQDLGNQVEILPGVVTARVEVLGYTSDPDIDGGLAGNYIGQWQVPSIPGLMTSVCRVSWSRSLSTRDVVIYAAIGAGVDKYVEVHRYLAADNELSDIIEIYMDLRPDGVTVTAGSSRSIGRPQRITPSPDDFILLGAAIADDVFDGADPDTLIVDSIALTVETALPRQTAIRLSEFLSLKNYMIAARLQSSVLWSEAINKVMSLDALNTGSFSVEGGSDVSFNDLIDANTSMTGGWFVPNGFKDVLVVITGRFDSNSQDMLALGDPVSGNGVTLKMVGSGAPDSFNVKMGAETIKYTATAGAGVIYSLMAYTLPVTGSASTATSFAVDEVDPTTLISEISPSIGQFSQIFQFNANYYSVSDGLAGEFMQVSNIMIYEFEDGIPDNVDAALLYMASNPGFGPYPGWHSIK